MATLELINYSAFYKQKKHYLVALNDINMTINDGDFVVVIGPSGCGKTTFLKALIGSLDYTEGSLLVNGTSSDDVPIKHRNFGYVSQAFDLYKTMTVFDNIAFPLRVMKVEIEEINKRVTDIASELGLSHLLTRRPKHLSIGQQQRVSIARALIKHPSVMLFDEPFSNLDVPTRKELRKLVRNLYEKYKFTAVFVTHDKEDTLYLAKTIMVLDLGSMIYYGAKEDLLTNNENLKYWEYLYGE